MSGPGGLAGLILEVEAAVVDLPVEQAAQAVQAS
jgi:hypothetical protein